MRHSKTVCYSTRVRDGEQYKETFTYTALDSLQEEYLLERMAFFFTKLDNITSHASKDCFLWSVWQFVLKGHSLDIPEFIKMRNVFINSGRNKIRFNLNEPDDSLSLDLVEVEQFGANIAQQRINMIAMYLEKHGVSYGELEEAVFNSNPGKIVKLNKRVSGTILEQIQDHFTRKFEGAIRVSDRKADILHKENVKLQGMLDRILEELETEKTRSDRMSADIDSLMDTGKVVNIK